MIRKIFNLILYITRCNIYYLINIQKNIDKSNSLEIMKRFFSGSKSNESENDIYMSSPAPYHGISNGTSPNGSSMLNVSEETLSTELVPIVTLLTAHTHRRYHEGTLMILHDLKNDGSPAMRKWKEVYGVLIGTQLAFWDTKELVDTNEIDFRKFASKPTYLNLNDATLKSIDAVNGVSTTSNQKLENALVISTTLKNRYFLQFNDKLSFCKWNAAIHLSIYENVALQEGYTGAFLSSRGARLSDIKVILASTKYDYEDWVSVRFGTGMPWRRCYAVITQQGTKKSPYGQIKFYENDKKKKKADTMAVIKSASEIYAVYPSSPKLIDTSTIIKVEGTITFEKIDNPQSTNIFIMPEKHMAVPGYDTIIRFLIPAMNAFQLYGRPKRLIANKEDPESLLFGLPTLPHIYYLQVDDLTKLATSAESLHWSASDWKSRINEIMLMKNRSGYTGCGTSKDLKNSINTSFLESGELFDAAGTILSPKLNAKSNSTSPKNMRDNKVSPDKIKEKSPERKYFNKSPERRYVESPEKQYMKSPERINSETNSIIINKRNDRNNESTESFRSAENIMNERRTGYNNTNSGRNSPIKDQYRQNGLNNRGRGHIPEQSTESISSIFNMYGNGNGNDTVDASTDSLESSTSRSVHSKKSEAYNAFVSMGAPRKAANETRVASEIEKLGAGIKDISMNRSDKQRDLNENIRKNVANDPDPFDPSFMEQDKMVEYDNELNSRSVASSIHERASMNRPWRGSPPRSNASATSVTSGPYSNNSSHSDIYHSAINVDKIKQKSRDDIRSTEEIIPQKPKYNPFAKENNDNSKEEATIDKKERHTDNQSPYKSNESPLKSEIRRSPERMNGQEMEKPHRRRPPVAEVLLQPVEQNRHPVSNNQEMNNVQNQAGHERANMNSNNYQQSRQQQHPHQQMRNYPNNNIQGQMQLPMSMQQHYLPNGQYNNYANQGYPMQQQGQMPQYRQQQQYGYPQQQQQYGYPPSQQQMYMQQQQGNNRMNQGYMATNGKPNTNPNQRFPRATNFR